jgi:hypothetical protein
MARTFGDELAKFAAKASAAAKTPEAKAEIVQELACCLGRSVAMLSGGNQELMGVWLEGAVQYAHEEAAGFQRHGRLIAGLMNFKKQT